MSLSVRRIGGARCAALKRLNSPDVVCLQEVTAEFLDEALAAQWLRKGYRVSCARPDAIGGYDVWLATRWPLRSLGFHALPTEMGRRVLVGALAF